MIGSLLLGYLKQMLLFDLLQRYTCVADRILAYDRFLMLTTSKVDEESCCTLGVLSFSVVQPLTSLLINLPETGFFLLGRGRVIRPSLK